MKKINKLNAECKKATKAQKRVMIAQDVLAQLKTKRYVAESGCWVQPNIHSAWEQKLSHHDSVQELFIEQKIESCNVCALGGLFMSCTNFNNNTLLEDLDDVSEDLGNLIDEKVNLSNKLNKIFFVCTGSEANDLAPCKYLLHSDYPESALSPLVYRVSN